MKLLPDIFPVTCHTDHVGQNSTFVAIRGFRDDGTKYISIALDKGATSIITEATEHHHDIETLCQRYKAKLTIVPDARKALAAEAHKALDWPSRKLKLVGITGTKGKTTTTFLIEHIVRHAGHKTAILSTIYNKILTTTCASSRTTPESDYLAMFFAECVKQGVEYVVMEVSSHALKLQRVHGLVFDSIGFTNLNPEHMDFHPTMDDYFASKTQLFLQLKNKGSIIINNDDTWGKKAIGVAYEYAKSNNPNIISLGTQSNKNERTNTHHITCTTHHMSFDGIQMSIQTKQPCDISCPTLFGAFNSYNLSMATLTCLNLGISSENIISALSQFPGVPGRLQRHMLKNGAYAFVDYAHNPSSFEAVLTTLRPHTDDLIVVFGCGGDRDKTKRPVMGQLAAQYANTVIITEDNPRFENRNNIIKEIIAGIATEQMHKIIVQPDRHQAIEIAAQKSRKGSIIALLGKGHENYYLSQGKTLHFDDLEEIRAF